MAERLWGYLDYRQGICAILRQSVILLALGFSAFFIWVSSVCSFIFLLYDGNVKPLHLMRNKVPHIFGPHLWLGRFQRDFTYTDPSSCIVSLRSKYHLVSPVTLVVTNRT